MKTSSIKTAALTDKGLVREDNEDFYLADEQLNLYIVADGMGGHRAGEVASRVAVETINKNYRELTTSQTPLELLFGTPDHSLTLKGNYILSSIRLANRVIFEMAGNFPEYKGMGTTIAVLAILPGMLICANAGDSRIYLVRNGEIEKLSEDHTIVNQHVNMGFMTEEEAEHSPLKHVLAKNLGATEYVDPEIFELEPSTNDKLLLCSDGLTDVVTDDELAMMIGSEKEPDALCRSCIDRALQRGGHDNTTVISVFFTGSERRSTRPLKKTGSLFSDLLGKRKY
jgi:protein phosphatase